MQVGCAGHVDGGLSAVSEQHHHQWRPASQLAQAGGRDWTRWLSLPGYFVAISLAFIEPLGAILLYLIIAAAWLVPDQRIEQQLTESPSIATGQG